jgi:hypothetical protein
MAGGTRTRSPHGTRGPQSYTRQAAATQGGGRKAFAGAASPHLLDELVAGVKRAARLRLLAVCGEPRRAGDAHEAARQRRKRVGRARRAERRAGGVRYVALVAFPADRQGTVGVGPVQARRGAGRQTPAPGQAHALGRSSPCLSPRARRAPSVTPASAPPPPPPAGFWGGGRGCVEGVRTPASKAST